MTLPVLFWRRGKELFCTVSKQKSKKKEKIKAYLPTLFFSGKEPETQLFFFGLMSASSKCMNAFHSNFHLTNFSHLEMICT